jgi:hypothetical protein
MARKRESWSERIAREMRQGFQKHELGGHAKRKGLLSKTERIAVTTPGAVKGNETLVKILELKPFLTPNEWHRLFAAYKEREKELKALARDRKKGVTRKHRKSDKVSNRRKFTKLYTELSDKYGVTFENEFTIPKYRRVKDEDSEDEETQLDE